MTAASAAALPWDETAAEETMVWDPTPYLQAGRSGRGRRVVYDLEGDGLLEAQGKPGTASYKKACTQFWCMSAEDIDTGERFYWGVDLGPDSIEDGFKFLAEVDLAFAHHGIGYDYPVIEKLRPGWQRPLKAWDSEVIAKLVWPYDALIGPDLSRIRSGKMPGQFLKRHSLKAWGYRTGTYKGEYHDFSRWSPEMAVYLMGDIDATMALIRLIFKKIGWTCLGVEAPAEGFLVWPERTLEVECEVARIIFEQEQDGVRFDVDAARKLVSELQNEKARIEKRLVETFGSWWQPLCDPEEGEEIGATMNRALTHLPDITVRRFGKTGKELKPYVGPPMEERVKGDRHVPIEWTTFNPASRDHLGMRLQFVYGWKPKKFGKDGKPAVDETTLEEIPEAVLPADMRRLILDFFVVNKTLGMLNAGQKAWLRLVTEEGRMHGRMDTCGAITRRGTHSNPNLSQVPKTRTKKVDGKEVVLHGLEGRYGEECRALFVADEGWEQTGVDASALELILLGHYLHPLDGGAFSDRVCDPKRDPHTEHAELCGTTRADAKTTIYLKIYGGSAFKLSLDPGIIVTPDMVPGLLSYRGLPMMLRNLEKRFDREFVEKLDDMQKARIAHCRQVILKLEEGIVGLQELTENVTRAGGRGWLKALDGSKILVRKDYASLNALLQSAGAIACKLWQMLFHREMAARGYVKGRDYKQVIWSHDELQLTHKPGLGPIIKEVAESCMVRTGELLGLRGRFRTDGKTGLSWRDCH